MAPCSVIVEGRAPRFGVEKRGDGKWFAGVRVSRNRRLATRRLFAGADRLLHRVCAGPAALIIRIPSSTVTRMEAASRLPPRKTQRCTPSTHAADGQVHDVGSAFLRQRWRRAEREGWGRHLKHVVVRSWRGPA